MRPFQSKFAANMVLRDCLWISGKKAEMKARIAEKKRAKEEAAKQEL